MAKPCSMDLRERVVAAHRGRLPDALRERPDLTLAALRARLAQRNADVCLDTVWRFLRRQGRSFKKTRRPASGSDRT